MANGNIEKVADWKVQPYGRDNEEQSNLEVIDKHKEERKEKKLLKTLCIIKTRTRRVREYYWR